MWLRTAMNYQYRYGNGTIDALKTLYNEGGIPRLYQGLPFALIQGPLSRFGDTASNILILSLLDTFDMTGTIPLFIRTGLASLSAGIWRILIMPVDTMKTIIQVYGSNGTEIIRQRVDIDGLQTLYRGSLASSAATVVGHYPWFLTYNYLSSMLPTQSDLQLQAHDYLTLLDSSENSMVIALYAQIIIKLSTLDDKLITLLRSAFIGLCASSVSDISSNSLRVLKTSIQTESSTLENLNYFEIIKRIVSERGVLDLFVRGLETRLLVNALQGALFSVLFKYFNNDQR